MPYEICVKNRLSHSTMISLLSELGVATAYLYKAAEHLALDG